MLGTQGVAAMPVQCRWTNIGLIQPKCWVMTYGHFFDSHSPTDLLLGHDLATKNDCSGEEPAVRVFFGKRKRGVIEASLWCAGDHLR